jgi:hypothetical protein
VVPLHPLNSLAVEIYLVCTRFGPALAERLAPWAQHPDRGLLAQQLAILVDAFGATWVGMGLSPAEGTA